MASSAPARPRLAAVRAFARPQVVRSGMLFGSAIAAATAVTGITQLALARLLAPDEYSVVITLFVAITVAGVPLTAMQAGVARAVAAAAVEEGDAAVGAVLSGAAREFTGIAAVALGVAALAGVPLSLAFHVHRTLPIVLTGVAILLAAALTVVWGGLQGTNRFGALSAGQLGFAIAKLAGAVGAAAAGAGAGGIVGALAAASAVTLAAAFVPLLPYARAADRRRRTRALTTRYSGGAAAALTLFAALTTIDVVVARAALPAAAAGAYAAASVTARALLLVPTAITTVLFPRVATMADPARERRHLLAAVGATVGTGALGTAVLFVAGHPITRLVFGAEYTRMGSWVGPLAAAMTVYGVAFVYLVHSLSLGRSTFWRAAVPFLAVQVAAFAVFHESGREIAWVQVAVSVAFVAAAELYDHRRA